MRAISNRLAENGRPRPWSGSVIGRTIHVRHTKSWCVCRVSSDVSWR